MPNPENLSNTGKGRAKGVPNKVTGDVKKMILGALTKAGGQTYLARQAEKNPAAFMALLGKVMPLQLTGEGGGPIAAIVQVYLPKNER